MSDDQLKEFGLTALGHRLKLRDFCGNKCASTSERTIKEREEKLEKLRTLIGNSAQSRKGKSRLQKDGPNPKKQRVKESLRFEFGWKHWSSGKFVQKKMTHGGGNRTWDVPRTATLDECLDIAKSLFFPGGKSPEGEADEMALALGNYRGDVLSDLDEGGEKRPFTAARYKNVTALNRPRLYLLSKRLDESDDEGNELGSSPLESFGSSVPPSEPPLTYSEITQRGDGDPLLSHTLMGTSEERRQFFDDLEKQLRESERLDREKVNRTQQQHQSATDIAAASIQRSKVEGEELENLRMRRELRVPSEPQEESDNCVTMRVRHQFLGIVSRKFTNDSSMNTVYDWIGSLCVTPKFFSLAIRPEKVIYPEENIAEFSGTVLCMTEMDEPLPLSKDEEEVSFFKGKVDEQDSNEADLDLEGFSSLFPLSLDPPDKLLSGDEPATHSSKVTSTEGYPILEAKRKEENGKLAESMHIVISRHDVVAELLKLYQDNEILAKQLVPSFQEDDATGDGVLREMYSLFWEHFLTQNCSGSSQFSLALSPQVTENYIAIGRIITHQFLQCASFPVQLARASVHHMLFGKVDDGCLLDSFLQLLPPRQRNVFDEALEGKQPFPLDDVIDVLDDYNVKTLPSAENLRALSLTTAINELVEKPFLALLKMREGMGSFWNDVSPQMIDDIYSLYNPTASKLIDHLHCIPLDRQESKVFKWLKLYLREAESGTLTRFLQFCTGSQVLVPDRMISVRLVIMSEMALRPRARTCFGVLEVPRNFLSFNQLKENFDLYINRSDLWDLKD